MQRHSCLGSNECMTGRWILDSLLDATAYLWQAWHQWFWKVGFGASSSRCCGRATPGVAAHCKIVCALGLGRLRCFERCKLDWHLLVSLHCSIFGITFACIDMCLRRSSRIESDFLCGMLDGVVCLMVADCVVCLPKQHLWAQRRRGAHASWLPRAGTLLLPCCTALACMGVGARVAFSWGLATGACCALQPAVMPTAEM